MWVEVVHALPGEQELTALEVAPGTTALEAVRAAGLAERIPDFDPSRAALGIFGQACDRETVLRPGDRVEILRPLEVDPKESRRRRAAGRDSAKARDARR